MVVSDTTGSDLYSNLLPTTESENVLCTDFERPKSPEGCDRIDSPKTMIENSLEHIHTKLVEDGDIDTGFGKASYLLWWKRNAS